MDFFDQLTGPAVEAASGLIQWKRSTQMCTPASHAFLYVLLASWVAISLAGIYLWRKVIRTKRPPTPATQPKESTHVSLTHEPHAQ